MRTRILDGSTFVKCIQARGVKGLIRIKENKVLLSYKMAGKDILEYQDAPQSIDKVVSKAREFCALQGLNLWTY